MDPQEVRAKVISSGPELGIFLAAGVTSADEGPPVLYLAVNCSLMTNEVIVGGKPARFPAAVWVWADMRLLVSLEMFTMYLVSNGYPS